jgi:hypothetical protein
MKLCLCWLVLAGTLAAADNVKTETLRGKLIIQAGQAPAVETADHRRILLDGDQPTRKVLHDERVNGFEMEARGHFTAPDRFTIDPQHTRALLVRDGGHLKMITYWCDVCGIRAYTPGPCVCCQKETTLDLRDPDDIQ